MGGNPRVAAEFVFQLTCAPPGVADEGTDDVAWAVGVVHGLLGGDADGPAQNLFFTPPEGGKSELVLGDGAAGVDGDEPQRGEILTGEEITDGFAGGVIENQAVGALAGVMLGEEDDGAVEGAVAQGGVRQEQLPMERN